MNLFAQADQWLLDPKFFCLFDFAELSALRSTSQYSKNRKIVPYQIYVYMSGCMITAKAKINTF